MNMMSVTSFGIGAEAETTAQLTVKQSGTKPEILQLSTLFMLSITMIIFPMKRTISTETLMYAKTHTGGTVLKEKKITPLRTDVRNIPHIKSSIHIQNGATGRVGRTVMSAAAITAKLRQELSTDTIFLHWDTISPSMQATAQHAPNRVTAAKNAHAAERSIPTEERFRRTATASQTGIPREISGIK